MIKVNGIEVKPTIFPDQTSQIWKLPEEVFQSKGAIHIVWHFENERELMDIASLAQLFSNRKKFLDIPYLPFGRQDKEVSNTSTFNLHAFATLINSLEFNVVSSLDVHNPELTTHLINNFTNQDVWGFHDSVLTDFKPNLILYPDEGAYSRYYFGNIPQMVCKKSRDPLTGNITNIEIPIEYLPMDTKILLVDDICDGGATFISIAKQINELNKNNELALAVTHGIFSKGTTPLINVGIKLYTTNSLPKNKEGYKI